MSKKWTILGVVGVVLVAAVGAVLGYPAWSASRGDDVRWTLPERADALLDHDAERLLLVRDEALLVVDRVTGQLRETPGHAGPERLAALVPGGVVASDDGRLTVTGRVSWEKAGDARYSLAAVDVDAGLVVAGVTPPRGPRSLMAFALADGAPVWTVPDLARAKPVVIGPGTTRPPGWLRETELVPVIRTGGYTAPPATQPARWSLVDVATGTITGESVATEVIGPPVAFGSMATAAWGQRCADLSIIGGPEVTWPDGPLPGECFIVWAIDTDRLLLAAWAGDRGGVALASLALDSGVVTRLDWTGTYPDSDTQDVGRELTRSWGRYLVSRGVVHDTVSGARRWRGSEVWLTGDTAVVAEPVTGIDRLAAGASAESRWLRLADAATGEPTGGEVITDHPVLGAYVLDRGELVVLTSHEVFALLG